MDLVTSARTSVVLATLGFLLLARCAPRQSASAPAAPKAGEIALAGAREAAPAVRVQPAPLPREETTPEPESAPVLPGGIEPGKWVTLQASDGADIVVAHGAASARRVIVYLHGACGDIRAPEAFMDVATERGTLIAIFGDRSCGKSKRFYWGPDTGKLQARIVDAVARVSAVRGVLMDPNDVVLMGYSQGAARAQELVKAYPERYPRVILAGIPIAPSAQHLARARGVVVLGGEHELRTHMHAGLWALKAHGVPVKLDVFPGARHGEFGPEGSRVMRGAFAWLLDGEG